MFEAIERFRRKMDAGDVCLGAGITLADSCVVEAIAPSVDFVWIDLEHTHLSYETVHTHLIAARAGNVAALVRVRGSDVPHIKPVLDIGADGIIVPQVRSADEVKQIVSACRYPPLGTRGFGPRRAAAYGRSSSSDAWLRRVNDQVFVAVQIENADALAEVEEIAGIEGLDSIVLGPYDLSIALGQAGALDHPEVISAMQRIISVARSAGKYSGSGMGAHSGNAFAAIARGVQWIQCGDDYEYMVAFVDRFMEEVRMSTTKSRGGP